MSYYNEESDDKKDGEFYQVLDDEYDESGNSLNSSFPNSPLNDSQEVNFIHPLDGLILDSSKKFDFNQFDQEENNNNNNNDNNNSINNSAYLTIAEDNYIPIETKPNDESINPPNQFNNSGDGYYEMDQLDDRENVQVIDGGNQENFENDQEGKYYEIKIDKNDSMLDQGGKLNHFEKGNDERNTNNEEDDEENNIFINKNNSNEKNKIIQQNSSESNTNINNQKSNKNDSRFIPQNSQDNSSLPDYDHLHINALTVLDESIDFENHLNIFNPSKHKINNNQNNNKEDNRDKEMKIANPHDLIKNRVNSMNNDEIKVRKKKFNFKNFK